MKLMHDAEYARHRGVKPATVAKWKQRGFLVFQDGLIHPQASDAVLNSRPTVYRGGRASKRVGEDTVPDAGPVPDPGDFSDLSRIPLAECIRRKEAALAATREIGLAKLQQKLITIEDVQPGWTRVVLSVRSAMLAIPGRLRLTMPHLSVADIETIRKTIHEALKHAALNDEAPPIEGIETGAAE